MKPACRMRTTSAFVYVATSLLILANIPSRAQETPPRLDNAVVNDAVVVVRTGTPRETLQSFFLLQQQAEATYEAYRRDPSHVGVLRLRSQALSLSSLLDLSEVAPTLRNETGLSAVFALLDIVARVGAPPLESVPDNDAFDDSAPRLWRFPATPITIAVNNEGERPGEFLFSSDTVTAAPRFYERIRLLEPIDAGPIPSWTETFPQLSGPLFPPSFVESMPPILKLLWFDTPIWKVIASLAALAIVIGLILAQHVLLRRRRTTSRIAVIVRHALTPVLLIVVAWLYYLFVQFEVNVSGAFGEFVTFIVKLFNDAALAWLLVLGALAVVEWVIKSPHIPDESLNANLLRLGAKTFGFLVVCTIVALSLNNLGIPVLGIVAGLGFGGLAIALAVRPTLENLVGGIILFMDKPVKVGDYCEFGDRFGTVESIGIRSTKVRALDRTLISIPNATFVDLELVNWAECDQMLISTTIGLRYETTPDQLRHVLAKIREMAYAHPRIAPGTVRIRLVGYGAWSLDIEVRIYALTRERNEFYAIREDVLLRINEIVAASGTSFAFPSQTLYMARDGGLDQTLQEQAEQEVNQWRRTRELPFPDPSADRVAAIGQTLDYPPKGSVRAHRETTADLQEAEPLSGSESAEPTPDDRELLEDGPPGGTKDPGSEGHK